MRILIIDDEISTRKSIRAFIETGNEEIFEADNGIEGYQKIMELKPNLIFLDMNMPLLDGADLLNRLDGDQFSSKIIIVSGYTDFRYTKAAIVKKYVVDYIQKPIDAVQLQEAVSKVRGEEISIRNPFGEGQERLIQSNMTFGVFVENYPEI